MDHKRERSERRLTILRAEARINLKPELIVTADAVPLPFLLSPQHMTQSHPGCVK